MTEKLKALIEAAAEAELFDGHGCLSGDCPHEKQRDCFIQLYTTGAQAALDALADEAQVQFDAEAAREAAYAFDDKITKDSDEGYMDEFSYIEGARWQHGQDFGRIQRLEAEVLRLATITEVKSVEISGLKLMCDEYCAHVNTAVSERDALEAEVERLRRALNWIVNNACSFGLEAEMYVTRAREALALRPGDEEGV